VDFSSYFPATTAANGNPAADPAPGEVATVKLDPFVRFNAIVVLNELEVGTGLKIKAARAPQYLRRRYSLRRTKHPPHQPAGPRTAGSHRAAQADRTDVTVRDRRTLPAEELPNATIAARAATSGHFRSTQEGHGSCS